MQKREMESSSLSLSLSSCSKENMELIQQAILQLMEEEENTRTSSSIVAVNEDDDDLKEEDCRRRRRLLVLSRLLSQVSTIWIWIWIWIWNWKSRSSTYMMVMVCICLCVCVCKSLFDGFLWRYQLDTLGADEKIQQPSYAVNEVEPTGENLNKVEVGNCGIGNEEIVQELKKVKRQNFITHCLLTVMIILTVGWQLSEVSLILMVKNGMTHPFRSLGSIFKGMLKGPKMNIQDGEKMSSTKEKVIAASSLPGLKIPELPLPTFDFSNDEY